MDYEEYLKLIEDKKNYKDRLLQIKSELEEKRLKQTIETGYDKAHQIDFIRINVTDLLRNINYWLDSDE